MLRLIMLAGVVALFTQAAPSHAAEGGRRPNVVILLSDDLGWGELGVQGNKQIPTPHQDSIARNGVRFTQGYVAATYCSPCRAGLLTGRYPTRFGHEFNPGGARQVAGLPLTEVTLADRLKALGYATAAVGKWHLGDDAKFHPTKRGFDEFYGTLANTPFFHPKLFVDSRKSNDVVEVTDPAFYTTDAYAERACDFIGRSKDKPFFLYLPFNAQHAPLQAPAKYLDRAKALGITEEKRLLFAAMMIGMDDAVGRVLAKLKEVGQEENTLVWYHADNGGPTQSTTSNNGPLRGFKATTLEGGIRVPFMAQWKGKLPAGKTYDHPIIQLDIFPTTLAAVGGQPGTGGSTPAGKPAAADQKKLDGVDLMPFLTGGNAARPHQTLFWRFGPQWAVRDGDFKLVASRLDDLKPQLFNLADDIGEAKDLSATNPEKVKELRAAWEAWSKEQAEPLWGDQAPTKKKKKQQA